MLKKIGGNSSLSERGEGYARALAAYVHTHVLTDDPSPDNASSVHARLWTSSLRRTVMTGKYIRHDVLDDGWVTMRPRIWRGLDEIYAGVFDGMTYREIEERFPAEFAQRASDKLGYRYPRGESYLDVSRRAGPRGPRITCEGEESWRR